MAAQIQQYERLSDHSYEALKTATLERAKKRRQKEILDTLRNQVEAAKQQISNPLTTTTFVPSERDDAEWQEQGR